MSSRAAPIVHVRNRIAAGGRAYRRACSATRVAARRLRCLLRDSGCAPPDARSSLRAHVQMAFARWGAAIGSASHQASRTDSAAWRPTMAWCRRVAQAATGRWWMAACVRAARIDRSRQGSAVHMASTGSSCLSATGPSSRCGWARIRKASGDAKSSVSLGRTWCRLDLYPPSRLLTRSWLLHRLARVRGGRLPL